MVRHQVFFSDSFPNSGSFHAQGCWLVISGFERIEELEKSTRFPPSLITNVTQTGLVTPETGFFSVKLLLFPFRLDFPDQAWLQIALLKFLTHKGFRGVAQPG
ncbi:MAG TPA: hypothetical protein PLL06_13385 [Acidobacteriota bacterium]|nr:hypothetical protein [Acidobacteriota bacterium]